MKKIIMLMSILQIKKIIINHLIDTIKSKGKLDYHYYIHTTDGYDYYASYSQDNGLPIYCRVKEYESFDKVSAEIVIDFNKLNQKRPFVHIEKWLFQNNIIYWFME
ncbi:MAG UNVERIFIED_CONTAM: hypothetical protein LVQ98_08230 [Rickettsiaceae bacterium]|jgi:protease II